MWFPANREAMNAELQSGLDLLQSGLGALSAGKAIGQNADRMAALGLSHGEIEDMAKDAAHRSADSMKNAERRIRHFRHQNHRSVTTTVSPGLRTVPGGTVARWVPAPPVRVSWTSLRWARGVKPPAMATALSTVMFGT